MTRALTVAMAHVMLCAGDAQADNRLVAPDVWTVTESPFLGSEAYFSPERRPLLQLAIGTTLRPLAELSQAELRWASEHVEVQFESTFVRSRTRRAFHVHAAVGQRFRWGAVGGQVAVFRAPATLEYPVVRDPAYVGAGPYVRAGDFRGAYLQAAANYQQTTHDAARGFSVILGAQVLLLRLRSFSLDVTGRLWISLPEHLYAAGLIELRATFRGVMLGVGWRPNSSLGLSVGYSR